MTLTSQATLFALLAMAANALVGCSADVEPLGALPSPLTQATTELPGTNCAAGGQALHLGVDANHDGKLDAEEIKSTTFVCNGSSSPSPVLQAIAVGDPRCPFGGTSLAVAGDDVTVCNGAPGADGQDGAQGPGAPELTLGQFLPSQTAKGAVITCAGTSTTSTTATCTGLKLNGVPARLAPVDANVICGVITGKGYDTASGLGQTSGAHLFWKDSGWTLSTSATSPMDNLTCKRGG